MSAPAKSPRSLYDLVVEYTSVLDVSGRRRLAEFLDVQEQTINCWRRGKSVPSGVRALRMHYLLSQLGELNSEWRVTEPAVVETGRLVAFRVLAVDALIAEFKDKVVDEQNVVRMMCGHKHIRPENLEIFQKIVDTYGGLLEPAISEWSDLLVRNDRERLIAELSKRLVDSLPLCEEMVTDDWSAEDRHALRNKCGKDTIFRLYNALGALCGEKARQITLKGAGSAALNIR